MLDCHIIVEEEEFVTRSYCYYLFNVNNPISTRTIRVGSLTSIVQLKKLIEGVNRSSPPQVIYNYIC